MQNAHNKFESWSRRQCRLEDGSVVEESTAGLAYMQVIAIPRQRSMSMILVSRLLRVSIDQRDS